jgi:iron complex outermembrane recepter protein
MSIRSAFRLLATTLCTTTMLAPVGNVAHAETARSYDIPSGPLATALNRFAEQSNIQLSYEGALTHALTTAGLNGPATIEEGMARLLTGTGLAYRRAGDVITIVRAPHTAALSLDTVQVEATPPTGSRIGQTDQEAEESRRSDAITVTGFVPETAALSGLKTDTPLIETPQSVSVISMDEMRVRNILSVSDAVAYTAGAFAGGKGNTYGGDAIALRGFGNDGTTGTATNTYIDGLRLGGTGYLSGGIDPWLYDRIEVVKGPASVLFGQSVPGGLINMVSKRPQDQAGGEIFLRYGSYGRKQVGIDVTGPVEGSDNLLLRFVGTGFEDHDVYAFSNRQRVMVAPSLTWRIGSRTTLTVLTHYQHDDFAGSTLNWLPTIGTIVANPNGRISRTLFTGDPNYQGWNRTTASAGYELEHHFSDAFTVRQNFRYTYDDLDDKNTYISSLNADLRTASRQLFGLIEHANDYTLDTQADLKLATGSIGHRFLFGIDWQQLNNDTYRSFATGPDLDVYAPVYFQPMPTPVPFRNQAYRDSQTGLYAQDQLSLGGWRLVLGLRQDWASSRVIDHDALTSDTEKSHALTKRIALLRLFDNGLAPYVSYSDSFVPQSGTDYAGKTFDPERGKQIEAGIKYQPPGRASFVTASIFDLRRRNVLTTDSEHPDFEKETGEIRMRGIELEANVVLAKGLKAIGSYTFLDARVTHSDDTVSGINPVTLAEEDRAQQGLRPLAVPRHTAALWLDYAATRGVALGAGARYIASTFGDDANLSTVPAYTLFDASLRFDLGQWDGALQGLSLAVKANNVFDKTYVASCVGVDRCYYGNPRNVTVDLGFRW